MKRRYLLVVATIVAFSCCYAQKKDRMKYFGKTVKLKRIADKNFDKFHFNKAVKQYKELLGIRKDPKVELRLAESFRRLNDHEQAAFWYGMAQNDGLILTQGQLMDYALSLKSLKRYHAAKEIFGEYDAEDKWASNQARSLERMDTFYVDQHAYEVSWESFNSTGKDFGPAFMEGQLIFVSNRNSGLGKRSYHWDESNFLDLYLKGDSSEVDKVSGSLNTKYHEGPATFWEGGTKVLFTRNSYYRSKVSLSTNGVNHLKIFYAEKQKSGHWGPPKEFPFNNDEYSVGHPSISRDGMTLYFASDMPGGYGGVDLYRSDFKLGQWQTSVNLGPVINSPRDEMFPYIHDDQTLYFASNGHPGLGGLDLYKVSLRISQEVSNLGFPVNTSSDDFGWCFRPSGNQAYFSSNRPGGMGDDDIYSVLVHDYSVEVILVDEITGDRIMTSGRIDLLSTLRSQMNDPGISIGKTQVRFGAKGGTSYLATGSADGYYQGSKTIKIPNKRLDQIGHLYYEIPLKRLDFDQQAEILMVVNNDRPTQLFFKIDGDEIEFNGSLPDLRDSLNTRGYTVVKETILTNIYYDFDQSSIRTDAARSLDKVVNYLSSNGEVGIVLDAHTDIRGSNQYNQLLAKRRVAAARQYLIQGGIRPERIFTGSHGEEQTFIDCVNCSEDEHQSNRRTEIRIEMSKRAVQRRLTTMMDR